MDVIGQLYTPAIITLREKTNGANMTGVWVGPRDIWHVGTKRKILESNPGVQSAVLHFID
jgi:hypothetical protein